MNKGLFIFYSQKYKFNVTYLTLAGNQIEDITPLYSLHLKDLVLTRNNVKDLSGIDQMNQLDELWIGKNQIEDVTPLAKMTHLKVLDLPNNEKNTLFFNKKNNVFFICTRLSR